MTPPSPRSRFARALPALTVPFAVATLALLAAASPAAAQPVEASPSGATSDAARQEAAKLFGAGEMAFKKADYESAAQSFEAAYRAFPAAEIAFSAAQAYRLGNALLPAPRPEYIKRSIELYELYVTSNRQGTRVRDAATHLDSLRKLWRELDADAAARAAQMRYDRTQLTVWASAENAEVAIDGKTASAYDYVDVEPGEHVIAVTAPGYFPFEQRVSVAKGAQVPVAAELRAKPATVRIATEDGAEVAIDGRPVALQGDTVEATAGKRYLTITRAGREPFARELVLSPGGQVRVNAPLVTTPRRKAARWVMWGSLGMLGVAAISATGAIVADGKAVDQRDQLNQPSDVEYEKWRSRRDTLRTAAFATGAVALAGGAIAAVLYFSDHPRANAAPFVEEDGPAPKNKPQFTPMVWSDGAGVAVQGGF